MWFGRGDKRSLEAHRRAMDTMESIARTGSSGAPGDSFDHDNRAASSHVRVVESGARGSEGGGERRAVPHGTALPTVPPPVVPERRDPAHSDVQPVQLPDATGGGHENGRSNGDPRSAGPTLRFSDLDTGRVPLLLPDLHDARRGRRAWPALLVMLVVAAVAIGAWGALRPKSGDNGNRGVTAQAPRPNSAVTTPVTTAPSTTTTVAPPLPSFTVAKTATGRSTVKVSAPSPVTVTASARCWVRVTKGASGPAVWEGTLNAGETHDVGADLPLRVRFGNTSAGGLQIDGQVVDLPSGGGSMVDIVSS